MNIELKKLISIKISKHGLNSLKPLFITPFYKLLKTAKVFIMPY